MENIKIPFQIILKLKNAAPSYDVSENSGRRMGYYGDSDESAKGYKAVCVYVQNGLADYLDLFKEVARGIFKIQVGNQRKYPLVVFGFGKTINLQHDRKYFDFCYQDDSQNYKKVAEAISRVSGSTLYNTAIIPELFPKTDARSFYSGKTRIEQGDLLVIIGRKNEVFLSETLKDKITYSFKKQILFVEICKEDVSFKTRIIDFEFKTLEIIL